MNKTQSLFLAGVLTLGTIFAAQAQRGANDDKLLAFNDAANTEVSVTNEAIYPSVREGNSVDAEYHSGKHKLMVVHVSGGSASDKTAEEYAEELVVAAAASKYPYRIVAFIEETDSDRKTAASVYLNGDLFVMTSKKGRKVDAFLPETVKQNIDYFTKSYAKKQQITLSSQGSSVLSSGVALNNDQP